MANSFRYPNNLNTHKKKADAIKETRTRDAVRAAHEMRNNQNTISKNGQENHYSNKNNVPVL